jgi:hypothetical protein
MPKTLLFVFLLFASFSLSGQIELLIETNPIQVTGSSSEADIEADFTIINQSEVTVDLLWERILVDVPKEWLTWICDENNCYLPDVNECPENKPNRLEPNDTLDFQVHIKPNGVDGEAQIEVTLFDLNDQTTMLGTLNSYFSTTTTAVEEVNTNAIRVFPNPTSDYFKLTHYPQVRQVVIYNIVGSPVKVYSAVPGRQYDVSMLPQGMYLVRLLGQDRSVVKTIRLSKR